MIKSKITREENSWLLDFMCEMWKWKDISAVVGISLQSEKDKDMFRQIYNKLTHEEKVFKDREAKHSNEINC